jgi:hypothetical protein
MEVSWLLRDGVRDTLSLIAFQLVNQFDGECGGCRVCNAGRMLLSEGNWKTAGPGFAWIPPQPSTTPDPPRCLTYVIGQVRDLYALAATCGDVSRALPWAALYRRLQAVACIRPLRSPWYSNPTVEEEDASLQYNGASYFRALAFPLRLPAPPSHLPNFPVVDVGAVATLPLPAHREGDQRRRGHARGALMRVAEARKNGGKKL